MPLTKEEVLELSSKCRFSEFVIAPSGHKNCKQQSGMDHEFIKALEQGLHLNTELLPVEQYKL